MDRCQSRWLMEQDSEDDEPGSPTTSHPGSDFALIEAVKNGRYRQAQRLLETGSGADVRDGRSGQTPLILCCTHLPDPRTRSKFVRLLLDAGADPNHGDRKGTSAMMHAAILGQVDTVVQLLDHPSIDLEQQDAEGNTALMYAACFGRSDMVALLLAQMGRLRQVLHLSQRNRSGQTALQLAERHGHQGVVAALGGDLGAKDRGLPLVSSFPVRWRRQTIAGRDRRLLEGDPSDGIRRALPRLAWTGEDDPPPPQSASHDEFRKVLTLLDAAMDDEDRDLQPTPDPDYPPPLARSYHFPVGGFFPPIRPLRTTALPPVDDGPRRARPAVQGGGRFAAGPFPHPL